MLVVTYNDCTISILLFPMELHDQLESLTRLRMHFTPYDPGGGGGTPYDNQCTMISGLDPHFRAWLDPIGSIFELGSIP